MPSQKMPWWADMHWDKVTSIAGRWTALTMPHTYTPIPLLGICPNERVVSIGDGPDQDQPLYLGEFRPQLWVYVWPARKGGYYVQVLGNYDTAAEARSAWGKAGMYMTAHIDSLLCVYGVADAMCKGEWCCDAA